ncbi:glycosyltransferase [Rufibacter sp. XAAS-G3-1]|uniref:glycosyltransferase n=1 Tax=Rufibacter sp. XAAS-G3-1 TaxID=2729134 RepID=UPI0015E72831|nr:glycosyltransferase [Rufibacter sp. XAAS-G3-1]
MNIVFFAHPVFLGHQSMPRYAKQLADEMQLRGHDVEIWAPKAYFFNFSRSKLLGKWLGYIDQYILFPHEVRNRLKSCHSNTLFVFTDQALGPWVPLVKDRLHVIHCHDFLALRSALGEIPENTTGWSGRVYQKLIRHGFTKGRNFISVSKRTREDLHRFLYSKPILSEVVYNGLNQNFQPTDCQQTRLIIGSRIKIDLSKGYLLHVGGNQFYKNRMGVIEMYTAWRSTNKSTLPLLLIGEALSLQLLKAHQHNLYKADIHFLSGIEDEYVRAAYAGATVFLFPSLAEGFGWPIAEAMASGCPVITTNEAPMTEVAGKAGFLIPRRPSKNTEIMAWSFEAAKVITKIIDFTPTERNRAIEAGIENAKRFNTKNAMDQIEMIYQNILKESKFR